MLMTGLTCVLNEASIPTGIAPYIKAAISDVKAYRDYKGYRKIPIGYRDGGGLYGGVDLYGFQNYLACNIDRSQSLDFYVVENFCKELATLAESPKLGGFYMFNAPLISYQYSCYPNWNYSDQGAIFMDNVTSTWSGTITEDWLSLAGYDPAEFPEYLEPGILATPSLSASYAALQSQWATLNPSGTPRSQYTTTPPAPSCPTSLPGATFNSNAPLPTLGVQALPSSLLSRSTLSPTASPTSSTTPNPMSSGISIGAKVAIGVVAPLVVIGAALAAYFWYRRKSLRARTKGNLDRHSNLEVAPQNTILGPDGKPPSNIERKGSRADDSLELDGTAAKAVHSEGSERGVAELDGRLGTPELAAGVRANAHELDRSKATYPEKISNPDD